MAGVPVMPGLESAPSPREPLAAGLGHTWQQAGLQALAACLGDSCGQDQCMEAHPVLPHRVPRGRLHL